MSGQDITLKAAQDLLITPAQNQLQEQTSTQYSTWGIGGAFKAGTSGFTGAGIYGDYRRGTSQENESQTTYTGSEINAKGTLSLSSGNDTRLIGSQVSGKTIVADVGGNLSIASLQDLAHYTENTQSTGGGFGGGDIPKVSFNQGNTNSDYASVTGCCSHCILTGSRRRKLSVSCRSDVQANHLQGISLCTTRRTM